MSTLTSSLKNEYSKRLLRSTGLRRVSLQQRSTEHYRMPKLQDAGGYLVLGGYAGPEIHDREWEGLTYATPNTDPSTFFAPITSATGELEVRGFWENGKCDLDGVWTDNAKRCPTIVSWVESIGVRFGRVLVIRMPPNTLRECRWGLHLDNMNEANPESNGWIVRLWLELTNDESSALVLRPGEFDRASEVKIPLTRYKQIVVDSEALFHSGFHHGPGTRYAVIVSLESGPAFERWIERSL